MFSPRVRDERSPLVGARPIDRSIRCRDVGAWSFVPKTGRPELRPFPPLKRSCRRDTGCVETPLVALLGFRVWKIGIIARSRQTR